MEEGESLKFVQGELYSLLDIALLGQHATMPHHFLQLAATKFEEKLLFYYSWQLYEELCQLIVVIYPGILTLKQLWS